MEISIEKIKELVTVGDVLIKYGYATARSGRIPCPVHGGKNRTSFRYDEYRYYCHSCHSYGDVITLIMELFGLNYKQAIIKINDDFSLSLTDKKSVLSDKVAKSARINHSEDHNLTREANRKEYFIILEAYQCLSKAKNELFPINENEELNPIFVYAVQNLGWMEQWLDDHMQDI